MPTYYYRGINEARRKVDGVMEAADELALEEKLKKIGFWLVSAREATAGRFGAGGGAWFSRVTRRDLIDFFTLLSTQVKAGVPLIEALEVGFEETENARFRFILEGIHRNIEAGSLFFEAMEKYPEAFAPHVISLVRAGEMSGKMSETFTELRRYMEWLDRVVSDIRQASIYPAIIVTVVSTFVVILFTFVVPRFVQLLEVSKVKKPLLTEVVFGISDVMVQTWWVWFLAIFMGTAGVQILRRTLKPFALLFDRFKLKMPVFGHINHMISLSRFAHNLATMYRSGIPILQALHLCRGLVGNAVVENAVREIEQSVASGDSIAESMSRHRVFPTMVRRMVVLGETTGNLDESLEHVATYYNEMIPREIKKIFSIVEPLIMIVLIVIVGGVALSIFLPLVSIMSGIK